MISPEFESLQILPAAADINKITNDLDFNFMMTASYLSLFEGESSVLFFETDNLEQEVKNGEN